MSEWRLLAAVGRFGILSPTAAGELTAMDKVKVSRASASLCPLVCCDRARIRRTAAGVC